MEIGTHVPLENYAQPWKIGFEGRVICRKDANLQVNEV